ncbi:MAG TPA: hypothetical protein VGD50_05090, partial [Candidatus Baltobacteraceae bacterium]
RASQTRAVFKLDAWHARYLPVLAQAFPDVPWVFLWRDAVEILVSHMRTMSYMLSAANAPAALGIPVTEAIRVPREEYAARVLAEILDAVERSSLAPSRMIDYRELPEAIWERIGPAFGIAFTEREIARIREAAAFHAKRPQLPFWADSEEKQAQASPEIHAAAERWLLPRYRRLEAMHGQ